MKLKPEFDADIAAAATIAAMAITLDAEEAIDPSPMKPCEWCNESSGDFPFGVCDECAATTLVSGESREDMLHWGRARVLTFGETLR